MSSKTTIVVPCYNEAARLRIDAYRQFADAMPGVRFIFVNDGSTDGTSSILKQLHRAAPARFQCVDLDRNRGKAEAVRTGMLLALSDGSDYAGYWDADLATPLAQIPRLITALVEHPEREVCFGARVQLLGRRIDRRTHRHYAGRVFATVASLALQLPVYDTQCGAKIFRVSPRTRTLFSQPFSGRWTFDIEIIARLARQRVLTGGPGPADLIYEVPLDEWQDVESSKVNAADFFRALVEVLRIRRQYLRHVGWAADRTAGDVAAAMTRSKRPLPLQSPVR